MLLSSEEFNQLKCGTAVSPITDFELYGIISHTFFRFHALCLKKPDPSNSFYPLFKMAASAFSERYLGSKTDSRVYTVKFQHFISLSSMLLLKWNLWISG